MKRLIATILAIVLCLGVTTTAFAADVTKFTDVKPGSWYYDSVAWAAKNGITAGTSKTTFSPDDTCTVAQMVTFVWRSIGSPAAKNQTATDDIGKALEWAYSEGLLSMSDVTSANKTGATRGATVMLLNKVYKDRVQKITWPDYVPDWQDFMWGTPLAEAILWAYRYGITNGTGGRTFSPDDTVTRAQLVCFLHRAVQATEPGFTGRK